MALSPEARRELLRIARDAVDAAVHGRSYDPHAEAPGTDLPAGAFVTLHRYGELRGCIGQIEARQPLADTVANCALAAAVRDPRFPPLTARELGAGTDIEISVLTPMQHVTSVEEIEVGRDGLLIQLGARSGLLLPQVATEWGWDRDTFLAHACRKAGLPIDAWRHGAEIFRFQAEIFGDDSQKS
jgi:AmmeMemoRadiSam system protein A